MALFRSSVGERSLPGLRGDGGPDLGGVAALRLRLGGGDVLVCASALTGPPGWVLTPGGIALCPTDPDRDWGRSPCVGASNI